MSTPLLHKYNYRSKKEWRKRSLKLAEDISKYVDVADTQHHFNRVIDFELLDKTIKHLKEVDQLLSISK